MVEITDIVKAFTNEITGKMKHPKCTTFFMSADDVQEKLQSMCEDAYDVAANPEELEFNEGTFWELIRLIKRDNPNLLEADNSISKGTTTKEKLTCYYCQRPGAKAYFDNHPMPELL